MEAVEASVQQNAVKHQTAAPIDEAEVVGRKVQVRNKANITGVCKGVKVTAKTKRNPEDKVEYEVEVTRHTPAPIDKRYTRQHLCINSLRALLSSKKPP